MFRVGDVGEYEGGEFGFICFVECNVGVYFIVDDECVGYVDVGVFVE